MRASRTPVLFQYMTYKFTAFTAALTAALSLTACGSGAGSDSDDNGATTASTAPAHALSDTVTVGNTLTISEVAVDTTGCTFSYPEELKRDAVKFQIVTTVDNQTGEDLTEALWSSDFTFTDADGLTVSTLDIASAEPPCSNDNARQFTDMNNGEKRRAAVTLEAPAGATTMTYSASTIPGAEPVTWDIAEEVAAMTVTRAGGSAGPNPTTEAGPAPAPGEVDGSPESGTTATGDNGFESGGIIDGPVVPDPDIPGGNQPLPGESSTWTNQDGTTGGMTVQEDGTIQYH